MEEACFALMSARHQTARQVVQCVLLGHGNPREVVSYDVILAGGLPSMMAVVSTTDTPAAEVATCTGGASIS